MTEKQESTIKCPFFVKTWGNSLECESLIGSSAMLTKFTSAAAMKEHVRRCCAMEDGGRCLLAMNLYDKYRRLESLERQRQKERKEMYLKGG